MEEEVVFREAMGLVGRGAHSSALPAPLLAPLGLGSPLSWTLLPVGVKLQQEVFRLGPRETFLTTGSWEPLEWRMEAPREVSFPESG